MPRRPIKATTVGRDVPSTDRAAAGSKQQGLGNLGFEPGLLVSSYPSAPLAPDEQDSLVRQLYRSGVTTPPSRPHPPSSHHHHLRHHRHLRPAR